MRTELTADDVAYVSMPLFHSNAVIAGWGPALVAGATVALRRRFSASQFLPDIRRLGATYANYVGTPLSYVLAQPPQPDDDDNPLRRLFGNEGAPADLDRFAERAGDQVMAAVVAQDGFDPAGFGRWVAEQPDAPPQWVPRYLRVATDLPRTAAGKVLVRTLARERWGDGEGEVWVRDGRELELRAFTPDDDAVLEKAFAESGRVLPP